MFFDKKHVIVFFEHLGSRHIHKEIKLQKGWYRINKIQFKTDIKTYSETYIMSAISKMFYLFCFIFN